MIAAPFFLLLAAILEVAAVFFATTLLENAVLVAAREIRTGQTQSGGGVASFEQRVCESMEMIADCGRIRFDVMVFESFGTVGAPGPLDEDGELTEDEFGFDPGAAGDIVLVRVFYPWPLLMPGFVGGMSNMSGNQRLLTAAAVFRNEPFDD